MKRLIGLAILAGVLGSRSPAFASAAWTFNPDAGPSSSTRGFQVDSVGGDTDTLPYGLLLTLAGSPVWGYGTNRTVTAGTSSNDLIFQSYTVTNGQPLGQVLNVRSDNGQVSIGPGISTNTGVRQVQITAGTPTTPLAGLAVTTYGAQNGLALIQSTTPPVGGSANKRVQINLNGLFQVGTDAFNNNGTNCYVADTSSGNPATWRYPFTISNQSNMTSTWDALVLGSSTDQLAFYGAAPVSKPVITGCRSDGTALKNLLTQLQTMGLITDQTTP
jgi:hypothetical protein